MPRSLTDEQLARKLEEQQVDRMILDEAARRIRNRELQELLYTNEVVSAVKSSPILDERTRDKVERTIMAVRAPRVSSSRMSSLAAQVMRDPNATDREKSLAASVLSQDETPGQS
jgi:hypothetical protein